MALAALLSALGIAAATGGTDTTEQTLERAAFEWEAGDYVSALTRYQQLLSGPAAAAALEAIALQTGELYRSIELTQTARTRCSLPMAGISRSRPDPRSPPAPQAGSIEPRTYARRSGRWRM